MVEQVGKSRLRESLTKRDKFGAELHMGDVCVWCSHNGGVLCVYISGTKGNNATGRYGRFMTEDGVKSISYKNVILAYDCMGKRVYQHSIVKDMMRRVYG